MNVRVDRPVEEYLGGVRAALADLPSTEVEEIVDDVRGHLADVRAELGADADLAALTTRLGPPTSYAAELRSAAGYPDPPPAEPEPGSGAARLAVVGLVAATFLWALAGLSLFSGAGGGILLLAVLAALLAVPALVAGDPRMRSVAALPVVRRLAQARPEPSSFGGRAWAFVGGLQTAWWLVRAFVAAMLVGLAFGNGLSFEGLTVALFVVFSVISVRLGFRSRRDRRWLWLVVPLNAFAAVLLLTGWPGWSSAAGYDPGAVSSEAPSPYYGPGLVQDGEREITDIRPVDSAGQPLEGVYLFDQDGRPIDTRNECDEYYGEYGTPRRDVDPYPRGSAEFDPDSGRCTIVPAGPLVVAVPSAGPTTSAPVPPTSETAPVPPTTDPAQPTG